MDVEFFAFFEFLYRVNDLLLQVEVGRRQFQRLVEVGGDLDHFCEDLLLFPVKPDLSRHDRDRDLNDAPDADDHDTLGWIVRVDPRAFVDGSLVAFGLNRECDFSFPARGNGAVEMRRRAASPRFDVFDQKGLVALVYDVKGMIHLRTLHDLAEIRNRRLDDHAGTLNLRGRRGIAPGACDKTQHPNRLQKPSHVPMSSML